MLDISKLKDVYSSSGQAKDQYEQDFYAWTQEQSQLLRLGNLEGLDLENLAEEIASLGKQQKQELRNRFGLLIGHLLKWDMTIKNPNRLRRRGAPPQPIRVLSLRKRDNCYKSWKITIDLQREEILELVDENPSLKPYLEEAIAKSYKQAIALVVRETPLDKDNLPSKCPYPFAQVLDEDFYPN